MRWTVDFKPEVAKQIAEQRQTGELSIDDIAAIKRWVLIIERFGLVAVQTAKWHDHPLEAEWTGFRAAAFSPAGRIIYSVENDRLVVWVVRVTASHNYKK